MSRHRSIPKVTAFVTRGRGDGAELLLFQHPIAGIQLPAGTVELGESPEAAVLREVAEEAGLTTVLVTGLLAKIEESPPPSQGAILRLTKVFSEPSFDASSQGHALRRGTPVEIVGAAGDFVEVIAEPLDESTVPPRRVPGVRGFVRRSLVATRATRYLFHLTLSGAAPDRWDATTDGHTYRLFWAPLRPMPGVHPAQQPWLAAVHADLLQLTAAPSRPA